MPMAPCTTNSATRKPCWLERSHSTRPPKYSRYIYPGSPDREIIRLMEWRGSLSYTFSKLRKTKAESYQS